MKIRLIACEVFFREFSAAVATSPHVFDIKFLSFGLHDTPEKLREAIQGEIDGLEGSDYDAIVLGYGLCSRGTAEVRAGSIPIIVPRMHDCITMLLGSRQRYNAEFGANPGTYYYSPGWIERKAGEVQQGFVDDVHRRRIEERYAEYVEKYGEDNARYLIDHESQWQANYTRAVFIDTGFGDINQYRQFTTQLARDHGWDYAEIAGDPGMIERMARGEWDEDTFLRVEPGQTIAESFDEKVLRAAG